MRAKIARFARRTPSGFTAVDIRSGSGEPIYTVYRQPFLFGRKAAVLTRRSPVVYDLRPLHPANLSI